MTPRKAILLCEEARESKWQLPLPPSGRIALVGWRLDEGRVEAGVPDEVASLLARALIAISRVTYPSSSNPTGDRETVVRPLEPAGAKGRLRSMLSHEPSNFFLVSTRDPEVAKSVFEDPAFPWCLQGQVVVLTPPGGPAPSLDRQGVLSLIDEPGWLARDAVAKAGIAALIRPGVDGDVMGVVTSSEVFKRELWDAIRREAALSGFECQSVEEHEFAEKIS